MKRMVLFFGLCVMALFVAAPTSVMALDMGMNLRGYVEGSFYPPHNEFDPNPGIEFKDRVVSRYSLEAYVEASPKAFPRFFVFGNPRIYLGDSRPQLDYNYQADPIVANLSFGLGYRITENLEVRIAHGRMVDLGGYTRAERLYWNAIKLRWTFGK